MKKLCVLPLLMILISFNPISFNPKNTQEKKHKIVWLTTEDWKELEKISTKGKKTTAVVDFKSRLNIITQVQYKHEDVNFSKVQLNKLEKILKKYE